MESAFGKWPKWLMSDNAGEYTSGVISKMLGNVDITHMLTVPQKSEDNRSAEKFNGTIMNAVRVVPATAEMPWH